MGRPAARAGRSCLLPASLACGLAVGGFLAAGCAPDSGGREGTTAATAATAGTASANAGEAGHNGLVLLKDTLKATVGRSGAKVTGTVVNRTGHTLNSAQISFDLFDQGGKRVGAALATTSELEDDARWEFEAPALGHGFVRYRVRELTGD
jgi:hypothetical protein